jgi:cytochrome c peroxidase
MFGLMSFSDIKDIRLPYPSHFPNPTFDFQKTPLDSTKILLGRILFYDPILSKDNSISCASCHSPYNAFAHTDHDLSHGIFDAIGTRNAPALFNLAWQKEFMWDGAINHIDMQALAPISHPGEMGSSIKEVVSTLNESNAYKDLFQKAFGEKTITGAKVLKALTQFQLTLVSANAKYDKVKMGKDSFTLQENNGYLLFKKNCNTCHQEPLFSTYQFANNGLPVDTTLNDFGRWQVTGQSKDSLHFKIPSLRNLTYSYPYMHDGRFKTLREVLNHYTKQKIPLTSNEKADIISFLLTLNDADFVFDKNNKYYKIKG